MKVFLSHSTRDREFAERLAEALKAEMFAPWLCEISIDAATNWVSEINRGLRDSDAVLLLWSPHAASSPATELEWTSALAREIAERKLRLGVVYLADCKLPEVLRTRQYIDARSDQDAAIRATLRWLKERREAGRAGGGQAPIYLPDYRRDEFVGRGNYLENLRSALIDQRGMCLLSGEPGAGKSTIALMFALEAQRDFDAVVFQTCGQRKLDTIIGELADKLKEELGDEVVKAPPQEKLKAIKNWFKDRQALLILDDIWLGSSGMTDSEFIDILPGPPVSILFTSRRAALPRLHADDVIHVDAFSTEEAEEVLKNYLGARTTEQYREPLLEFVERVERLPIAVTVGAEFLRNQFGPLGEAARSIVLANLKNEIQDVSGLLQRAIEAQNEPAQRLLKAASVCAPDGFWLPLAIEIAGLDKAAAQAARDNLVHASLLRVLDQERQHFQLHSLVREQACSMSQPLSNLQQEHATALEQLFKDWQTRWKECRKCLQEIIPAFNFLWNSGERARASRLSHRGCACAKRIGELDVALRILQTAETLWKSVESHEAKDALQRIYGSQALILRRWGRLDAALALHKKEEEICLQLDNKDGLQASYGNQALILQTWGKLDGALTLLKKQEGICLQLDNKDGLQASYGNQATILQIWGRLDEALALHKKKEEICLELGNKDSLQISYGNQATILKAWGRLDEAMALHRKEEEICLELGNKDSLQRSYGNQALILQNWGRLDEAMILHKKQEEICLELGNKNDLQGSYGNQALILKAWGRLDEALTLHKKQEEICLELGNKEGLQRSYNNQAVVLHIQGRGLPESLTLLEKQEAICLELGIKRDLAYCYWSWGILAREQGDQETEKQKLETALAIFTELKMPQERDAVKKVLEKAEEHAAGQGS